MPSQLQTLISNMNRRSHNLTLWALDVMAVHQAMLDNQKLKDFDHNNRRPYKTDDSDHGYSIGSSRSYIDNDLTPPQTIFYMCTNPTPNEAVWEGVVLSGNNAAIDDPGDVTPTPGVGLDNAALDSTFILE